MQKDNNVPTLMTATWPLMVLEDMRYSKLIYARITRCFDKPCLPHGLSYGRHEDELQEKSKTLREITW
jgi:hypothetical protein